MSLSSVSIQRPVLALVMNIVIIVFGIIGFTHLGVREYPQADRPVISVRSNYPGANASVIENLLTEPLEQAINSTPGIRTMTSVSRDGQTTITVEFDLDDDLDRAANDVRDRVSSAMRRLPPDADPPTVEKADADGDPIVFLNVQSDRRDLLELTDIADRLFKSRLETIDGVGRVDIWGQKEYAMRIWLDTDRLAAHDLSPTDVRRALDRANVELPSGRIEGESIELTVTTRSRLLDDPDVFNNIIVKKSGDDVVRLRDVGYAEIGPKEERTILKRNGIPMVGVILRPQPGANQIAIVDEFQRRLEWIKRDLPEDIRVDIGFDTSKFIRASIVEVKDTILIAIGLVCLTVFLFLREARSTLIPLLTIPVSVIGAFFVMYVCGFTINILTLLGIVLAIGLVVDDALIVLENIYSKMEQGMDSISASINGTREIFFAVIATTLSLVAVFAPIVFLGGLTGVLFREFGVTLAGSILISAFTALTLTPMLCSRLLKKHEGHGFFYRVTEPFFVLLNKSYRRALDLFLKAPILAIPITLGILTGIGWFWKSIPKELAPLEDRSLLVMQATGPQGANYDYMSIIMDEADGIIAEAGGEDVVATLTVTSPNFGPSSTVNTGSSRIVLTDPDKRDRSQGQIASLLSSKLRDLPGAEIFIRQQPTIRTGGRGLPLQFVIQNKDFDKLREIIPIFLKEAQSRPEFAFVNVDLKFNQPEIRINIDRNRAEALGVAVSDIAQTIQAAFSGQRYGYFIKDSKQYEIIGQLTRQFRDEPLDIKRLTVRNDRGQMLTLDNLVELEEVTAPPVLYRFNRYPSATFSASMAEGYTLGQGIDIMREIADKMLDDSFTTDLAGESREFAETGSSLLFIFALALLLVYLVLSAQFESFRDPIIIMITVPLALIGGLAALYLFGHTLNIFSQIGLIMLIGLVTKNGILLVEFANQRKAYAPDRLTAIKEAAAARLRPILMTAISTTLGALPIALALGTGAQSRIPLGMAVIGGLLVGTFLTLFIIPAFYLWFSRKADKET